MNLQHVNAKIFVDGQLTVDLERFIEVFHRWVADQSLAEMLVDVADYRHVPQGPGVVLVGHQADYSIDHTGGRFGLRYNRKAVLEGSNADRLRQAIHAAADAGARLESELPGLRFSRQEFAVWINDRALAPNTPAAMAAFKGELENFLQTEFGRDFSAQYEGDSRRLVGAEIRLAEPVKLRAAS